MIKSPIARGRIMDVFLFAEVYRRVATTARESAWSRSDCSNDCAPEGRILERKPASGKRTSRVFTTQPLMRYCQFTPEVKALKSDAMHMPSGHYEGICVVRTSEAAVRAFAVRPA
jgi:hypothetical protein